MALPNPIKNVPRAQLHEVVEQMSDVRSWGGKFAVPIPSVEVL